MRLQIVNNRKWERSQICGNGTLEPLKDQIRTHDGN